MAGLTVVTYGGGEILQSIFNAVAMLMNHQHGGFIRPFALLTASLGGVWAISKAFLSSSIQPLILHYFLPVIAIIGLLMIPTTEVHIEDVLRDQSFKVDHVPILLGKFSELTSSVGYQITKAVEGVMHVPNDLRYSQSGMIFGADTALDISRYQITNANLEKNLKSFCKQCALYDIALGRYTIDEMKKSTDLWKFFEDKTSKVRMIPFLPVDSNSERRNAEYLSCKDAMKKMAPFFNKEKNYYGQLDVCRHLPLTFQALTGMQRNSEELISQQLMMNVFLNEYGGDSFSKGRAYIQQRNTYQTLGALASSSLVTLRAVIEALIYAAFIFILPLSLLPGGVRFLKTWAGLVLWIQLWPPFYAILNYIMQTVSHSYASNIFSCIAGSQQGLSLFTSIGLNNLQQDIFALSGYLAISIPFITYAILKGGVGSFIHLASSMMTPAHTAAGAAAAEQTTGNYAFGNASLGQMSYKNTSGLHTSMSPNLSSGFFYENKGSHSNIYTSDEQIIRQSSSDLRTNFFSDESISQGLQSARMQAQSQLDTTSEAYSNSIQASSRYSADLAEYLAQSENFSSTLSKREAVDIQESARFLLSESENLAQQHGISSRESFELLAGLGFGSGVIAKGSYGSAAGREELMSAANNVSKGEDFQHHLQKLRDFSQSEGYSSLCDQGKRLSENYLHSLDEMHSSQESYQLAQTNLDQISETATWSEQNSQLVKHSLSQDFVNWAADQYKDQGGFSKVEEVLTREDGFGKEELATGFLHYLKENTQQLSPSFVERSAASPDKVSSQAKMDSIYAQVGLNSKQFDVNIERSKDLLSQEVSREQSSVAERLSHIPAKIGEHQKTIGEELNTEQEKSLIKRSLSKAESMKQALKDTYPIETKVLSKLFKNKGSAHEEVASSFQLKEEPFWMGKQES